MGLEDGEATLSEMLEGRLQFVVTVLMTLPSLLKGSHKWSAAPYSVHSDTFTLFPSVPTIKFDST